MYRWVVLVHVAAAFAFFMAHGASVNMLLRLRKERDPVKVQGYLEHSSASLNFLYGSLGVLLLGGIAAGFMGNWWRMGWIWTALGLLIALMFAMYSLANTYYHRVRKALGMAYMEKWYSSKESPPETPASAEDLDTILSSGKPLEIAVIGFGGLLVILWLMMFKPF